MRRSPLERSGLSMAATKQIHHRPKYQSNFVSKISAKILNTLERIMNKIPNIFSYEYTTPAKIQANKVQVSHKPACRKSNLDCAGNRKTSIKKTHYDVPVHCRTRLDSTKRAQSCKCLEPDAALAALRFAANVQFTICTTLRSEAILVRLMHFRLTAELPGPSRPPRPPAPRPLAWLQPACSAGEAACHPSSSPVARAGHDPYRC